MHYHACMATKKATHSLLGKIQPGCKYMAKHAVRSCRLQLVHFLLMLSMLTGDPKFPPRFHFAILAILMKSFMMNMGIYRAKHVEGMLK